MGNGHRYAPGATAQSGACWDAKARPSCTFPHQPEESTQSVLIAGVFEPLPLLPLLASGQGTASVRRRTGGSLPLPAVEKSGPALPAGGIRRDVAVRPICTQRSDVAC